MRRSIVVQKYGGTSVADLERIRQVAKRVVETTRDGTRVVVVVSAMGKRTDELQEMALAVSARPARRELDMLLSTGERETMALLALAIIELGGRAVSLTGSQVGIITDRFHADARIQEIRGERLRTALRAGKIPIVAGFQGVSLDREVTTLGRGGSDVTAVALAAVLRASRCELYKDVPGVFTENPREFPFARFVPELSYEELLELAGSGAQIIHPRACALAEKYRVPLVIRSSFDGKRGTIVGSTKARKRKTQRAENGMPLEKAFVRALTHEHNLTSIALLGMPKKKRCLHQVVTRLAEARVPPVLFYHGVPADGKFDLNFVVAKQHLIQVADILHKAAKEAGARRVEIAEDVCSVSVVGPGVGSDTEIMAGVLEALHGVGVHLSAFASSETRLTCFMASEDLHVAVAALMSRFKLRKK